ncbi:conserved hypothetical protein [Sulfolobus islandicus Y.G.57.14]|uniref:Uncharacterized protein n=6 Tax=Saccharolobus islandicus TaxID=43080 RepID=C3MN95_SACI2|nr:hypothetical protein [Sulfolobus islandicus]ACP36838.1 conserved hypothetical protein [Sulfolobus islandicus L.S.2.15]ACP47138.1 conserved hypothetical protein [Sulfolobus islandicus Y.G.57.14]ADB88659.1 conserved hypothetical protein [Sulfolobus islandicus L.D.8.5]ADX84035.1 conserved hypothetical protein [Sulfolobus islandicus HVE10/4]ADX86680.1 conserved hypothetical protein [Sulfolobus islandicus REY15A]
MPSLFGRKVKVIHHIDHLHPTMKLAIKTILDSYLPDIIRGYGFRYADPKWGEPIFIPYGYLDGEYKDTIEAFKKIMEEINERKEDGLAKFKEWYPEAKFFDIYRFIQYSIPGTEEGYTPGIAVDPLIPYNYFKDGLNEVKDEIKGSVIVASPSLSSFTEFKFYDPIIGRRNEIVDAYIWLNELFHEQYDKDKMYDEKLGRYYMNVILDFLEEYGKNKRVNDIEGGDVLLVPIFVWGKDKVFDDNSNIVSAWKNSKLFTSSVFHEIEALPVILNKQYFDFILTRYSHMFNKIILLGNKKLPQIDKCSECPSSLRLLKVQKEGNFSKVFIAK